MHSLRLSLLLLAVVFGAGPASASAQSADLVIAAFQADGEKQVGQTGTYTSQIAHYGGETVDAVVNVELGEAEQLVSVTPARGTCTQAAPVSCSLPGFTGGEVVSLEVKVTYTKAVANTHSVSVGIAGPAGVSETNPADNANGASFTVAGAEEEFVPRPSAETLGWTRTQSTLRVEAELSPFGAGTYYFEYGETKAYGKKSDVKKVRGEEDVDGKILLDGLDLGTKYHYRVVLVVDGKSYRGKDKSARTLGKIDFPVITLEATKRSARSTSYKGSVGDGIADAPGACKGTMVLQVYTTSDETLLTRRTTVRKDCTYSITIPFGSSDARRHGPKGTVLVQARFSGNRAVAAAGSESDRL